MAAHQNQMYLAISGRFECALCRSSFDFARVGAGVTTAGLEQLISLC